MEATIKGRTKVCSVCKQQTYFTVNDLARRHTNRRNFVCKGSNKPVAGRSRKVKA